MANEVTINYPSGSSLYFIIRRADGHVWDTTGAAFEDFNVMTDYDTAMTYESGSFYQGSVSGANFSGGNAVAGIYTIQIFDTGGGVDEANEGLGGNLFYWNGTAEVTESEYALQVNTIAEMSAGAPPLAPTFTQLLNFVYRLFRNKTITTSSLLTVRNDADNADLFKATVGNDGSEFTKEEYVSG